MATNWSDFEPVDSATPTAKGKTDWSQFEPVKPDETGDVARGFKESFQQLPQLGYGLLAGAGAVAEKVVGEGGIATGVKNAGVKGYNEWGDKIATGAKESDSWSYSYDQAKQGDFGALVDWLQHGLGYVTGQGVQMLATAGIGAVGGKFVAATAARQIADGMVAKEAARISAEAGGKLTAQQVAKQATENVAGKFATLGQDAGIAGMGFGQEGGEIFGDLTSEAAKDNRPLTGAELGKAFAATLGAGALEFVGDKVGLDILLGKSRFLKPAENVAGLGGRAARGGIAAAAASPIEAATEYAQTLAEEFGKGNDPLSADALHQAGDAAALGALGGAVMGGAGGMIHGAKQPPAAPAAPAPPPGLLKYEPDPFISFPDGTVGKRADVDRYVDSLPEPERIEARARLLGMAPVVDPVRAILGAGSIDDAIEAAQKALRLTPTLPVADVTEMLPTGDASELPGVPPVGAAAPLLPTGEATPLPRQMPVGQATELVPDVVEPPAPAAPAAGMAPRTPKPAAPARAMTDGDLVDAYVSQRSSDGTPAGRAFASDYAAGRITPADVLAAVGKPPASPDDRLAAAAAQAPMQQPGDLLTGDGKPYGSKVAANVRARRENGSVIEVDGGWVVRPKEIARVESDVAAPAGLAVDPAAGRAPDAGGGVGDVGRVADDAAGPGAAGQAAADRPADQVPAAGDQPGSPLSLAGAPIDSEWTSFTPESGTKAIPRADMPQIRAEHRGAMVNFLNARGITHESVEVPATSLKPTQAEFSPAKVVKAQAYEGGDRSILVSSDGHVLDGHHQWMAKHAAGEPVKAIRLGAPIDQLLREVREFPSVEASDGATAPTNPAPAEAPAPTAPVASKPAAGPGPAKARVYKFRGSAVKARAELGNTHRIQKVKGGFILRQATDKELAAAERAGRRLAGGRSVDVENDSLLTAIAKLGGAALKERADTIGTGNRNVGGKMLFTVSGKSIDTLANEDLFELGYVPAAEHRRDGGVRWLRDAIRAEYDGSNAFHSEQGSEWMEEQQRQAEGPEDALADFSFDELEDAGYTAASPDVQRATEELLAAAQALGIETENLAEDAARATSDQPAEAYHAEVQRLAQEAIAAAGQDAERADAGAAGTGDQDDLEAAERQGEGEGLTSPTADGLRAAAARAAAAEAADRAEQRRLADKAKADAEAGEFTLTGSDRSADVAAAAGQGDIFDATEPEPAPPPPAPPVRDDALVELRKRMSVLQSLRKCLG